MSTSQRLVEADLDRAIASTQECRERAPSAASWRACGWAVAAVLVGSCMAMVFGWIA